MCDTPALLGSSKNVLLNMLAAENAGDTRINGVERGKQGIFIISDDNIGFLITKHKVFELSHNPLILYGIFLTHKGEGNAEGLTSRRYAGNVEKRHIILIHAVGAIEKQHIWIVLCQLYSCSMSKEQLIKATIFRLFITDCPRASFKEHLAERLSRS